MYTMADCPLRTSRNFPSAILGRFHKRINRPDGSKVEIHAEGLSAVIMAAGAAFGISALWGIIQALSH
ncbi:MAG: hypothetical protein EpisKO_04430 [Epibacterium sp.]